MGARLQGAGRALQKVGAVGLPKGGARLARGKRGRGGPLQALASIFHMPAAEMYTGGMLHINCNGTVQVDNSRGLTAYTENFVELDMGRLRVRISGDGLILETVEKGVVLVRGSIFRLEFLQPGQRAAGAAEEKGKKGDEAGERDAGGGVA